MIWKYVIVDRKERICFSSYLLHVDYDMELNKLIEVLVFADYVYLLGRKINTLRNRRSCNYFTSR
jgi:hypothetical protein